MPAATEMAGVDMRLEAGAYRELHWHVASEWSLVLNGSCRIQVCPFFFVVVVNLLTVGGRLSTRMDRLSSTMSPRVMFGFSRREYTPGSELDDADASSGVPHSIQALDAGVEFLLVFDDGSFSEDNTFLASEVFMRNPVRPKLPCPNL